MTIRHVLIGGQWRAASMSGTFHAENPATKSVLPDAYPVSAWDDCQQGLEAAHEAALRLRGYSGQRIAAFLDRYAERIEARRAELVEMAHLETALAKSPRLADAELPRTTDQLRQAAQAARDGSWQMPTIDSKANIRSCYASIGPVFVLGPNNFPFAFGSVSGGDFAAAIAAGNPVIGKANSSHPGTTRLFAEEAFSAVQETDLPPATVQLVYRIDHRDGERLVAHPLLGATAYTGSRQAGLALKAAADAAGKPIYLELSSINPVILLPGALRERREAIAQELITSALLGTGQFCTNPGLVLFIRGPESEQFIQDLVQRYQAAPAGVLLSSGVQSSLRTSVETLKAAGATVLAGDATVLENGYRCANTLLQVSGSQFLQTPGELQTEAFGNATLLVVADDQDQLERIVDCLEGNLTGSIYSDAHDRDDAVYDRLAVCLRARVGRLLNDKMPTGVAVSPAMNHGGPYPATGHPGFTAVGIPASLRRFAMLQCYDNVRPHRLPDCLKDESPNSTMWRYVDGHWTQGKDEG